MNADLGVLKAGALESLPVPRFLHHAVIAIFPAQILCFAVKIEV